MNIKTTDLNLVSSLEDDDTVIVNADGDTAIVKFSLFKNLMSNSWNDLLQKPFTSVGSDFSVDSNGVLAIKSSIKHTHNNKTIIDGFTIDTDGNLLWNNEKIGSDYTLPIATLDALGGVKPDGVTITIDKDGTIHGANTYELPTASTDTLGGVKVDGISITVDSNGVISSVVQGLDFSALTTAMTTGTQSGINITADTENERFNFEVTGIPTIAIDSEGYWTINGERGENPTKAQGVDGESGYSPTAKVVPTENGATITIIDKNGETNATISNGTAGISPHINTVTGHWFIGETDTGVLAEGTNGRGITSVDKTASVDNVDTYTITYSDTTTSSFDVTNGITTVSTDKIDYTCTFKATDWSSSAPYTQTVNVAGITAAINPRIDIIVSDGVSLGIKEEAAFACVTKGITGDGTLTLYCYEEKPTVDMNIMIEVV